ncbi:MAG: L,D-transpeptidase family protein, partial [Gammaproteobacteria bacterium]
MLHSLPRLLLLALALLPALTAQARSSFIDRVVIDKSTRTLQLLSGPEIYRTYFVALGGAPEGHKEQEGDLRTPEGLYSISARQPRSVFYRGLVISYPNAA